MMTITQDMVIKITQDMVIKIENRFGYMGERINKTGLEYTLEELVKGNDVVLRDTVWLISLESTKGERELIRRMKFNREELRAMVIRSINNYTMMVPETDSDKQTTVHEHDPTKYLAAGVKVNIVNPKVSKGCIPTEDEDIKMRHERLMVESAPEYCDNECVLDVEPEFRRRIRISEVNYTKDRKFKIRKVKNLSNEV